MDVPKKIDYTLMDLLCSFETEGQLLRHVAAELGKEPFKMDITFSSLAKMSHYKAFEIFNDVLVEIDPQQKVDIDAEDEEARIDRLVDLFCILKYKPRNGETPDKYLRTMFERRNAHFLWELLSWMFIHYKELKKRAYLSAFLVKINIPPDFLLDPEIAEAYDQYNNKIEEFKYVHKKCESLKTNTGISELVKDIPTMDHDIACLSRKLETVKARIMNNDCYNESYLEDAHRLNVERTRRKELRAQIEDDTQILHDLELKCYYRESTLQELKKYNNTTCGDLLIEHLRKNYENFKYMVDEKIPYDIISTSRSIAAMEVVETEGESILSEEYLDLLQQKVFEIKGSIVDVEESRKRKGEVLMLEKLRNEAKLTSMRKSLWKENIEKMIQDCPQLHKQLEERRFERDEKIAQKCADRNLIHKVHGLKSKFVKMKIKMNSLQSEIGVLSTTKLLLEGELADSEAQLEQANLDYNSSVSNDTNTNTEQEQSSKSSRISKSYDEDTLRFLSQQSSITNELKEKVAMKKLELEPVINRVEELRQESCILEIQFNKCRSQFETEMIASEEPIRNQTEWIENMKQQINEDELSYAELAATNSKLKYLLARVSDEDDYQDVESGEPSGMAHLRRGVYSFKTKLLAQIVEQERIEKELNSELADIDENHEMRYNQLEMWSDLRRILQEKHRLRQLAPYE